MGKLKILLCIEDERNLAAIKEALNDEYELSDKSGAEIYNSVCYEYPFPSFAIIGGNDAYSELERIKSNYRFDYLPVLVVVGEKEADGVIKDEWLSDTVFLPAGTSEIKAKIAALLNRKNEKIQLNNNYETIYQKEQWHEKILSKISCGVIIYRKVLPIPKIVYFNDTVYRYMGITRAEYQRLLNEGTALFGVHEDDCGELLKFMLNYMNKKSDKNEIVFRSRSAQRGYKWIRLRLSEYGEKTDDALFIGTIMDVSDEINNARELSRRADFDQLTGIYNSSAFFRQTQAMLREDLESDYILERFNVENFKLINDLFGVKMGDNILKHLSEAISDSVRKVGGTYGYLGNDHFAVCFKRKYFDLGILERKFGDRAVLRAEFGIDIKINVGIYEVNNHDLSVVHICDRAKLAVQTIKGNARKCYAFYTDEMRQNLIREQEITNEMQTALDNREFIIYLQPIYSTTTLMPVYAEALVRWKHPRKGLVSPGDFIPIFEKNGFISKLDHYVWEEVCCYIKQRRDEGKGEIPISVNVSRTSLYNPYLAEDILALMERYEVSAKLLKIEITESAYNNCEQLIQRTAEKLKKGGLNVLIDDFGSGYSSLNTLKDLTADTLKIDMKFMGGFETSQRAGNILTSVVRMAKWLDMPVVAEGVETKTQVEFLRSIGCDYIQGYFFSKPLPINEFEMKISSKFVVEKSQNDIDSDAADGIEQLFGSDNKLYSFMNDIGGSVGVYELIDGGLEAIRVNEEYYDLFGYTPSTFAKDAKDICKTLASSDDVDAILTACEEAVNTGAPVRVQVKRYAASGILLYIDVSIRHRGGKQHPIFIMMHSNATERKMSEIASSAKLEILSNLSKMLSQYRSFNRNVNFVLRAVIDYFGAQNAFIYNFNLQEKTIIKSFEQCADGSGVQNIFYDPELLASLGYWIEQFKKNEFVFIEDVRRLPESRNREKKLLENEGAYSVLAVPLLENTEPVGFIGVSNLQRNVYDAPFLMTVSNCISGETTKQRIEKDVHLGSVRLKAIANTLAEGLVIYNVDKGEPKPIYSTENSKKLFLCKSSIIRISDITAVADAAGGNAFSQAYEKFLTDKKRCSVDCYVGKKWLSITLLPVNDGADSFTFAVFANDITDKKLSQNESELNRFTESLFGFFDKIYSLDVEKNTVTLIKTQIGDASTIGVKLPLDKSAELWSRCIVKDADRRNCMALLKNRCAPLSEATPPFTLEISVGGKSCYAEIKFFKMGNGTLLMCVKFKDAEEASENVSAESYRIAARQSEVTVLEWQLKDNSFYSDSSFSRYKISTEEPYKLLDTMFSVEKVEPTVYNAKNNEPVETQMQLELADGGKCWCSVSRADICNENKLSRIIVTIRDINERKLAEDERDNAYRRLIAVVDNVDIAVCNLKIGENSVKMLYNNGNFDKMFGRKFDDGTLSFDYILGRTFEEDHDKLRAVYKKLINYENCSTECRFFRRNSSMLAVRLMFTVLELSENEKTIMLVASDISVECRRDVEGVLNTIDTAFAIINLKGHGRCEPMYINEKLCELLEEKNEVIKQNISQNAYYYICEEALNSAKTAFMRAAIERESLCTRFSVVSARGKKIPVAVNAQVVLNHQGELVCYISAAKID